MTINYLDPLRSRKKQRPEIEYFKKSRTTKGVAKVIYGKRKRNIIVYECNKLHFCSLYGRNFKSADSFVFVSGRKVFSNGIKRIKCKYSR